MRATGVGVGTTMHARVLCACYGIHCRQLRQGLGQVREAVGDSNGVTAMHALVLCACRGIRWVGS